MLIELTRRGGIAGALALASVPFQARAADLKGGTLRVALLADMQNYDPQQFTTLNFPLIKNLYDSLIEYTAAGQAIPSLATAWTIAPDNKSVTVTLRDGVTFHSGAPFTSAAVDATLKKGADPQKGKNVFATMSVVKGWSTPDAKTVVIAFNSPVPDRQITDLLQFVSVIDPAGIDTVETKAAGTGAFTVAERVLGQRIRLVANPKYWRRGEPVVSEVVFTIFSDNNAANAALESGAVDVIYGGGGRAAVRLRDAGYTLIQGPGPLVQVLRINSTRGPFKNAKFRQAFNHLMDRRAILRVGYAGLGVVTALPWAPSSPAADTSYDTAYAFDLDKGRALLKESGLSEAEMNGWKLLVNAGDEDGVAISQIVQSTLAKVGIKIDLELRQGGEFVDAMLQGKFDAMFGGVGNVQKFPTRVATNSIYRTVKNPVLGDPHPHPGYVAAIEQVNTTFGAGDGVKAAYAALNKAMIEASFAIPTNTFDLGLIVANKKIAGFTPEIDNMLVARTIGFSG